MGQVLGGCTYRESMHCGPQVQWIARRLTLGMKTLERLLAQVYREFAAATVLWLVYRAGATELAWTHLAQAIEPTELP